jgi:hypothetical protein
MSGIRYVNPVCTCPDCQGGLTADLQSPYRSRRVDSRWRPEDQLRECKHIYAARMFLHNLELSDAVGPPTDVPLNAATDYRTRRLR